MTDSTTSRVQSELASLLDQHASGDLVLRTGLNEQKHTRRAAHLVLPSVLENMGNLSRSPGGMEVLQDTLERTSHQVNQPEDCAQLAAHLFGGRLPRAAEQLGHRAGISPKAAVATLEAMSGWVLTNVATLVQDESDPDALGRLLVAHGGNRTGSADTADAADGPSQVQPAATSAQFATEQPVAAQREAQHELKVAEQTLPASSGMGPANQSNTGVSGKAMAAGLAALLVAAILGFAVLGGGGDNVAQDQPVTTTVGERGSGGDLTEGQPASSDTDNATQPGAEPALGDSSSDGDAEPIASAAASETATDPDPVTDESAPDASDQASSNEAITTVAAPQTVDPTITALSIPLRDIKGIEPAAEGLIDLTFNKVTGEICFEVGSSGVTPPYAAHIHAGDFGIKGGVVADLGMLEPDSTGCISNLPADTLAILAAPSRHYAELHDASGDWTVRGQLSETVANPGIVPVTIPMRDILGTSPNSSGVLNFDFNTLTGEVCYSVVAVGVTPPFNSHIHAGPFGVKGGVVLDMGGLDTGNQGCVENDLNDTLAILADPAGHYAELHDSSGDWTVRGQLTETVDNPGVVSLAVPMVDIKNVEPSASGTLNFDFNTVTGEVCYDVAAVNITPPFATHIHAGDFGIKGGVVLDMGGLEDGSGGCVKNEPGDTLAILADPSGHYAELHDASGEWTIRGQLSEASNSIDADSTNLLIDTDGGGASLRLEQGIIYLDGAVSDQSVADEMTSSLAGITTPVVNNLTIAAGSPLPSGRVVIGDNIFFDSGSDRIKDLDLRTITALVELADSRPDWVMTVVGHTDNVGGDVYNLELSLRRAQALRNVLIIEGMNGDNMRIRGAGETAPIGDNSTPAGRAENRRIEFEFTPA